MDELLDTRTRARERAMRLAAQLARLGDASGGDVARLIVEPTLAWLGWRVLDPKVVRRAVHLADYVPAAQIVCSDGVGALLVIFATPLITDVGIRDFARWLRRCGAHSFVSAVLTDGKRWLVHSTDPASGIAEAAFACTLDDGDALLALGPERVLRPAILEPEPDGRRPGADGEAESPQPAPSEPAVPSVASPLGRTWDPTTYVPEVETWTKPCFVEFKAVRHPVQHWWQVVWHCAKYHLAARGQLPRMPLPAQRFPYASRDPSDLRRPWEVAEGWYIEINLNAHLAHRVATALLRDAGVSRGEILVVFE